MSKQVIKYKTLHTCKVGSPAKVEALGHPASTALGPLQTSDVVAYDPSTGFFETRNTWYVPAPFASWPDGEDCPVLAPAPALTRMQQLAQAVLARPQSAKAVAV